MNSPPPPPIHITNSGLHLLITNFITNEILGIWDDQDLIESDINTFKEIVDGVGGGGGGGICQLSVKIQIQILLKYKNVFTVHTLVQLCVRQASRRAFFSVHCITFLFFRFTFYLKKNQ